MDNSSLVILAGWVENYTTDLFSWAIHKVSDVELAKDLVQDTFLVAAEKFDGFKGNSSPKTWLFSILNHKIIDHYRKKVNEPVAHENESFSNYFEANGDWQENQKPQNWHLYENDENLLDDDDFQAVLRSCLDALPEKWNTCVTLKYLIEKKGDEICQELGITPSNFWQIVHRAKVQLRACVEKGWYKD